MISLDREPQPENASARKRRRVLLVAGLAVPLVAVAAALVLAHPRHPVVPTIPALRPISGTIVPGVSMIADLGPSVVYVIETPVGLVLVDSGLNPDPAPLRAALARFGLDRKPIRAVLLTHAHGDHVGAAEALRFAGAKVYAGKGDADVLRAGKPRVAFFSVFSFPDRLLHPTTVDVALKGGETLTFGDVRIAALAAPGHTPGSTCYLMERDGMRILFSGDVISSLHGEPTNHSAVCTPLGTYSAYLPPRHRGDAATYLETLRRLRTLSVPDLVLPGHPASDPLPQSPRLSQERWEAMLDAGIREMETLVARYKADGADFLDGNPKELLPGLDYLGDLDGKAVYGLAAANRLLLFTSTGAAGLRDFVREGRHRLGRAPQEPSAVILTAFSGEKTAGLGELSEKAHAEIVGPKDAQRALRDALPAGAVVSASEDLAQRKWFPVTTVPVPGRGVPAIAYLVPWAGKTVLFTHQIPLLFNRDASDALSRDLARSRNDALDFLLSVERLAALKPDLWLPAEPIEGQNANIYGGEWKRITDSTLLAGFDRLERQQ